MPAYRERSAFVATSTSMLLAALAMTNAPPVYAQPAPDAAVADAPPGLTEAEGQRFVITELTLVADPAQQTVEAPLPEDITNQIATMEVILGEVRDPQTGAISWVAPRRNIQRVRIRLQEVLASGDVYASGLVAIAEQAQEMIRRTYGGSYIVVPDREQVQWVWEPAPDALRELVDLRPAGDTSLTLRVIGLQPELAIDGIGYPVSNLGINYFYPHPDLPPIAELSDEIVRLVQTPSGLIAPRGGNPGQPIRIADLNANGPVVLYGSALRVLNDAIRDELGDTYGLLGHLVAPDPNQISFNPDELGTFQDLRPGVQDGTPQPLTINVYRVVVSRVSTQGQGQMFEGREDTRDLPRHRRFVARSPIQPGDLARQDLIEDYAAEVTRHPNRRLDATIAPSGGEGSVELEYIINENKPWSVFGQISNTGTDTTGEIRYRVGFEHTDLFDLDHIARFDYITSGFDESESVIASYQAPIFDDNFKIRAFGFWNEFAASDVGLAGVEFTGESWQVGGEAIATVYQDESFFLDVFGGARVERSSIEDITGQNSVTYLLPSVGLTMQNSQPTSATVLTTSVDFSWAEAFSVDQDELEGMGRFEPDRNFIIYRWDLFHTFFLEPLLNPRGFSGELGPDQQTLANELTLRFRGQTAFDKRLIPTQQSTAGGLFTVRGFDESFIAGDSVYLFSAEYAFHLGRALPAGPENSVDLFGRTYRLRRPGPYAAPDWDLIFRTFIDFAVVDNQDREVFERDERLLSTGIGGELRLSNFVSTRVDWGIVLEDARNATDTVKRGDNRVHFSVLIRF